MNGITAAAASPLSGSGGGGSAALHSALGLSAHSPGGLSSPAPGLADAGGTVSMSTSSSGGGQTTNAAALNLVEQERQLKAMHLQNFEDERRVWQRERLVWEQEQSVWRAERGMLVERIRELETALVLVQQHQQQHQQHQHSNLSPPPLYQHHQLPQQYNHHSHPHSHQQQHQQHLQPSHPHPSLPPARPVPTLKKANSFSNYRTSSRFQTQPAYTRQGPKIWEGASSLQGITASRVFPPHAQNAHQQSSGSGGGGLAQIPETERLRGNSFDGSTHESRRGSQQQQQQWSFGNPRGSSSLIGGGMDVSEVQPGLDSINLKRGSLAVGMGGAAAAAAAAAGGAGKSRKGSAKSVEFADMAMTAPAAETPEPGRQPSIFTPPNEVLVRDAGHTPKAKESASPPQLPGHHREEEEEEQQGRGEGQEEDSSIQHTPEDPTPVPDNNSRALHGHPDQDPPLSGPLGLRGNRDSDNTFLNAVTSRLTGGSNKPSAAPPSDTSSMTDEQLEREREHERETEAADEDSTEKPKKKRPDSDIPLKLKKSTNFGTEFGTSDLALQE